MFLIPSKACETCRPLYRLCNCDYNKHNTLALDARELSEADHILKTPTKLYDCLTSHTLTVEVSDDLSAS